MSNNWKINKTVDLARGIDGIEVWPHALLVTGDENAHEWNVTVMDNGKPASLGGSIRAYFVRSDGATVTAAGSVAGNVATVTLPEACYAYEGDLQAVMQLIQDDVSVTLSALLLRVRQIATDVIIDPGTEIPSLDDLLAQIESMKQATNDANAATTKANQAATNAETRVDEAISDAEGRVDTAVQSAETATSKANASAAAADLSKEAADTATKAANEAAERANKAASGVGIRKKIVDALPAKTEMEQDVLYLVRRAEPNDENVYDEYMLINGEVEAIGSTKTDLEDYAKKDELADVATSGSYNDLIEKPELAKVATSGSYSDLTGTDNVATKQYVGEQIDAIEIGGTNLCPDSSMEVGIGCWDEYTYLAVGEGIDGGNCFKFHSDNPEIYIDLLNINKHVTDNFVALNLPKENGKLTISFYAKLEDVNFHKSGDDSFFGINIGFMTDSQYNFETAVNVHKLLGQDNATTDWRRYSKTFDFDESKTFNKIVLYLLATRFTGTMWIDRIKIEKGDKATDWSPAPEDVDTKIKNANGEARVLVNNVKIGGRNLIPNTANTFTLEPKNEGKPEDNFNFLRFDFTVSKLKRGETYSLSADIETTGESYDKVVCFLYDNAVKTSQSVTFGSQIKDGHIQCTVDVTGDDAVCMLIYPDNSGLTRGKGMKLSNIMFERATKPSDWVPAPEDINRAISRRATVTYDYGGRNLKDVFGTPEALHAALAAEDYTNIAVGDYWPVTLNGRYYDYGTYTVKTGVNYYSSDDLRTQVDVTTGQYQGEYVSETAVSFSLSGSTYYVNTEDCLPYYERNFNSVAVKMEIAGINHYWKYGDGNNGGLLTNGVPHLSLISRDSLPIWLRMRKGLDVWEDTSSNNPWLGSAMYKTLNDPEHGILNLLMQTELSKYIYTGPNEKGMRAMLESKAPGSKNTTSYTDWRDRGILFLPTPTEVWGFPFQVDADSDRGLANQFALFRGSRRHILKGGGDGAGRADWWLSTSADGYSSEFSRVSNTGCPAEFRANYPMPVPVCFIIT